MAFKWEKKIINDLIGNVYEMSFNEAQDRYGLKLELAPNCVKDTFAYELADYFASINYGKKDYHDNQRYIIEDTMHKGFMISFKEAQAKYGQLLENASKKMKDAFEYEIDIESKDLTYQGKASDDTNGIDPVMVISRYDPPMPTVYAITCTKVKIPRIENDKGESIVNPNMEFVSTEIYEGKFYTSIKDVKEALDKLYKVDSDIAKRRPDFYHVNKMNEQGYVYSEISADFVYRNNYIYHIARLSREGMSLDIKHIFDDIPDTKFKVEGITYKKEEELCDE